MTTQTIIPITYLSYSENTGAYIKDVKNDIAKAEIAYRKALRLDP